MLHESNHRRKVWRVRKGQDEKDLEKKEDEKKKKEEGEEDEKRDEG